MPCTLPQGRTSVIARASKHGPRPSVDVSAPQSRRALISGIVLMGASLGGVAKAETFLKSAGVRSPLAEEEAELFRLRQQQEGEALRQLSEQKAQLEREAAQTQAGKLCATPFGVDVVGITELIALIGATVAGVAARQRKEEVVRLNEQLRKINLSLRQQARAGTVYAPGLTYAPFITPGSTAGAAAPAMATAAAPAAVAPAPPRPAAAVAVAPAKPAPTTFEGVGATLLSMEDEDMSVDQKECRDALRAGKRLLKEKNGAAAMVRFEKALMLSKAMGDKVQERRAVRGLAAAARLQGQYKAAIKHLERVLLISAEMKEFTGDADAYGTIADCYTDLGNFEKAAAMYDKYIELMNSDVPAKL